VRNLLLSIVLFLILFIISNCNHTTEPKKNNENQFLLSQTEPEFSHKGDKIVFEGLYDSIYAVHFVDISGNYLGYILNKKGYLSAPTWSQDDKKIAVSIEGNIFSVYTNGDSLTMLTNTGEDFHCAWSPDGKYIAYTKTICDPDCGIMIFNLLNNSSWLKAQYGSYASWSRDSKNIYYGTYCYSNSAYKGFVIRRINIQTLQKDSLCYVSDPSLFLADCTVSPNEEEILFSASYGFPARINIWKINLQSGVMVQMTEEGGNCPAYDPGGDKIVYTNTNINEGGLWIMNSDGSNKKPLTKLKE
jgi:Tol biopolymer transport system component